MFSGVLLAGIVNPAPTLPQPAPTTLFQTKNGVTITDQDIDRAMNIAMAVSGGGLSVKGRPIPAYHGSPISDLTQIMANPPGRGALPRSRLNESNRCVILADYPCVRLSCAQRANKIEGRCAAHRSTSRLSCGPLKGRK